MATKKWSIGIDLGGTKIEAAHVDNEGEIQNFVKEKTNVSGGPEGVQRQIEKLVQQLIDEASEPPVSVGIGVAGQIDKETGSVSYAPNLNWHDVPLDSNLEESLNLPVTVLNDVRAAAWGEWLHGAGKGTTDMICIFIGTGIGGGIVSGGQMLEGGSNAAGEIGHMTVMLDGPECHCGNKGCLEALAGSWAIEREAKEAVKNNPGTLILKLADGNVDQIKAKTVIHAFQQGDELATRIMTDVINAIAGGLTGLVNALNPQRIIMGGGVVDHLPDLVNRVDQKVRDRALKACLKPLKIMPTGLDEASGMIGAAVYTLRKEMDEI
ncbi:MAG TPA: ROK family protein [Balneolaceae bacterium]|nr:ROK family protein [Balneolaceae bacterium]